MASSRWGAGAASRSRLGATPSAPWTLPTRATPFGYFGGRIFLYRCCTVRPAPSDPLPSGGRRRRASATTDGPTIRAGRDDPALGGRSRHRHARCRGRRDLSERGRRAHSRPARGRHPGPLGGRLLHRRGLRRPPPRGGDAHRVGRRARRGRALARAQGPRAVLGLGPDHAAAGRCGRPGAGREDRHIRQGLPLPHRGTRAAFRSLSSRTVPPWRCGTPGRWGSTTSTRTRTA